MFSKDSISPIFQKPEGAFFEGECVPNLNDLESIYTKWDREVYPHAWRGAILCFTLGLFVCVLTGMYITSLQYLCTIESFIFFMERTLYFMLNYLKHFRPICALDHLLPTVYMLFSVYRLWIVAIFCFNIIHTWIGRICRWMGFKESVGGKNKKLCHFLLYFDEIL